MAQPITLIMRATGCASAQAETALAGLIDLGWRPPVSAALPTPPPAPDADPNPSPSSAAANTNAPLMAYTDGACSGNPGPGGWSVVFSRDGEIVAEHSGHETATTNNRMELAAIREALSRAPSGIALEIATDSGNAVGWLAKGWKRSDQAIAALCREIDGLTAKRGGRVTYRHVRGHRGDRLNERADKLATAAIRGGR